MKYWRIFKDSFVKALKHTLHTGQGIDYLTSCPKCTEEAEAALTKGTRKS